MWGVSLITPVLASFFYLGSFSYTSRADFNIFPRDFLLHIACWLHFSVGSFPCTHHAGFFYFFSFLFFFFSFLLLFFIFYFFNFLSREFLLHIPWLLYFSLGSFSYISFLSGEFGLKIRCCFFSFLFFFLFYPGDFSYTPRAVLIFIGGVSLPHAMLVFLFCGEFLLHAPCWPYFSVGSFSYTPHVGLTFLWGVSLTHPVLISFLFFFLF